jgi:sec-independent protein translocase protein TatB
MFGIGPIEIAIIVVFALVFVGPTKLPEMARQFGRFYVQLRRMTSDVRNTFDDYVRKAEQEILQEDREKLRKLLSKDLLEPVRNLDAEIRSEVNNSLSQSNQGQSHTSETIHHPDETHTPEGSKTSSRPQAGSGTEWEKS